MQTGTGLLIKKFLNMQYTWKKSKAIFELFIEILNIYPKRISTIDIKFTQQNH